MCRARRDSFRFFRSSIILSFRLLEVLLFFLFFFISNLFHRGFELRRRTRGYFWLWSGTGFVSDAAAKSSARVCFPLDCSTYGSNSHSAVRHICRPHIREADIRSLLPPSFAHLKLTRSRSRIELACHTPSTSFTHLKVASAN